MHRPDPPLSPLNPRPLPQTKLDTLLAGVGGEAPVEQVEKQALATAAAVDGSGTILRKWAAAVRDLLDSSEVHYWLSVTLARS
jgi:hypothetical protein